MNNKRNKLFSFHENHMPIPWHSLVGRNADIAIKEATLKNKASVIGRIGYILLSCGTGAWRVRSSMNSIARELGIMCSADIGLVSMEYTCIDKDESYTQSMTLTSTSVNTSKLARMETFVMEFPSKYSELTAAEIHEKLDKAEASVDSYSPLVLGFAAALACCGFTFLLGGGPIEMACAFFGAGVGNLIRVVLIRKRMTLFINVIVSVITACLIYAAFIKILESTVGVLQDHEAGYICSMLFIIPGFPFITSGIDLAKLDMRSGIERLTYALMTILLATFTAWILALILRLQPMDFLFLNLNMMQMCVFRLMASFCGVFGFSIMFNSSVKLAAMAGIIGAVANTMRLELIDLNIIPPAAAAFACALLAGLLASLIKKASSYPRITITVPSIVIMVPGLYLYKAIYYMGIGKISDSAQWFTDAALIMVALPLGLIFARIFTDRDFRYCI